MSFKMHFKFFGGTRIEVAVLETAEMNFKKEFNMFSGFF